jgi:hypothetical protein
MQFEFTEHPRGPEAQAASDRGAKPAGKFLGMDLFDAPEFVLPAGLPAGRRHTWFWLGVALLLGALIALALVGLASD